MSVQETEQDSGIWANQQFRAYLASTAFSGGAISMQQLLISWMLVGMLVLPGDQVGVIQAIIGVPGIFLMLWGGASADRADPRTLLIRTYAFAWVIPALLVTFISLDHFNIWAVTLFGLGISTVTSFTSPAQQAILNRVAGRDIQRAVTASTAIGFLVQIMALIFAGQMEKVGLTTVLAAQGICFALGAIMIARLQPVPGPQTSQTTPMWQVILGGLRATYEHKTIFHVLLINFLSSVFNAGAFVTVVPFIIKRVYEGDALQLATTMVVFFAGATISNLMMLKLMPIARPGKYFLIMQLSRMLILGLLWLQPAYWLMMLVMILWGLNMGVTTTLSRTIVQESAQVEFRARILSVYSLGLIGSAPIGALVLGNIIEFFGTLNALLPAMCVSVCLFLYGTFGSGVWRYESPNS
ncbi:MAG: MFS transporter [Pseudomonadales bacterium]|nr:MFS transporter [Pseudomonadales bacterium]